MSKTPAEINQLLFVPAEDAETPAKVEEAAFIYEFIKNRSISSTLEVGFAYGRSASHIVSATGSQHIVIDPFQSNYGRLGLKNMERLGVSQLVELREDFSHSVLPALLKESRKFDFIFIDGDHKYDGIFVDYYYSDLLVNQGGFLLFHDTWMRSTQMVMSFIENNRADYVRVPTPLRNLALYQKIGDDKRHWMHFAGFYTMKSLVSHRLIQWMASGESTVPKKIAMKIKSFLKKVTS